MVPFVGVFTSLMVSLAIKIYLTFFCAVGCESPAFEAWCRGRPLVAAFFCPRAQVAPLIAWLKQGLERREFVNVEGPFPWPHYRIKLEVVALDESVVGVRVVWFSLLRGNQQRPSPLPSLREAAALSLGVDEVWLHRDLHSDGSDLDPETTWRARPTEGSELVFHAYPELPFWLRRFDRRPPDRRQRPSEAVAEQEAPSAALG